MANATTTLKKISIAQEGGSLSTKDIGAEAQYVEISYDTEGNIIENITDPEVSVDSKKTLPKVVVEINNDISDIETDISDIETDISSIETNISSIETNISTKAAASAIGPVEAGTTATIAYSNGEHFYRNGAFCTALDDIDIGDLFVLNTNYKEGTISEDLKSNTNFVGTKSDWDALSESEKLKYETADII
jgi:hypothetical protein